MDKVFMLIVDRLFVLLFLSIWCAGIAFEESGEYWAILPPYAFYLVIKKGLILCGIM